MENNPYPPFYYILLSIGMVYYIAYQIAHWDEYCNEWTTQCEVKREPDSNPSYKTDIRPLFKKYCALCHGNQFLNYNGAYNMRFKIKRRVWDLRTMPPAYMKEKPSDEERALINRWVETGASK